MKKKFLLAGLLLVSALSFNITSAQVFVPKYLSFTSTSATLPVFNAGDSVNLNVSLDTSTLPQEKTIVEYGVMRQIKNGNTTNYEPIGSPITESVFTRSGSKIVKISVPNTLDTSATSTYVFYAKTTVSDDPDKESFVVSKQNFQIKPNDSQPLTKIKYIDLLQSNGTRFALLHGPTIYDLSKTDYKGVASSTSIEITFESNVDTTLAPTIEFNKIRSDVVVPDSTPEKINIKKGLNNVIIPLPTFNYDAGVYQGVLKLGNPNITDVKFQYIVGGEMVSFSQPEYSKTANSQVLNFNIYGTPMDLDLDPVLNNFSSSTIGKMFTASNTVYSTEFTLKNKVGKELYTTTQDLDFSTSTYSLVVPASIQGVSQVSIKTVNRDGKVIYEGTKDLNLPKVEYNIITLIALAVLFIIVVVLSFVFRQKYLKILFLIIALIVLFLGVRVVTADTWNVPATLMTTQSFTGDGSYYYALTINHTKTNDHIGALIRFNTDIQREAYDLNDSIQLTYNSSFESCNNYPTQNLTSLSLYGSDGQFKASSSVSTTVSAYTSYGGSNWFQAISYQDHNNTYTSNWSTVDLGKPAPNDFVKAIHKVTGAYGVGNNKDAKTIYGIPLLNVTDRTTSDMCIGGKINHVTTIGNAPYVVKIINSTATDVACSPDTNTDPNIPTDPNVDVPPTDTTPDTNPGLCGISTVDNNKNLNLNIDKYNLCSVSAKYVSNSFVYPVNQNTAWTWRCKSNGSADAYANCKAQCGPGLTYCPATGKCSESCGKDKCQLIPGTQTVDDPIYKIAHCSVSLNVSVKLDKPYASNDTSKCSVSWTASSTPPSSADVVTTCSLDGVAVGSHESGFPTIIGRHTLTCITKITGSDDPATVLSSEPIDTSFKCSKIPSSIEI